MQIVMMRHGQTEANERHVYAGHADSPLTARGEAQARQAGVVEGIGRVYTSPLARARRTAEICFPRAEIVEDAGLSELDFGVFEGRSANDMEDDPDYRAWVDGRCEGRCPGGECRSELTSRVSASIEGIVRAAAARGEDRVVVVGHGGTLMAAMSAFADPEADYFSWRAGNCEGFRAEVLLDGARLRFEGWERFSDLSFLEGARCEPPSHSFFANRACEYFPCHEGVDPRDFNCLFCYCPLYALGPDCGGDFTYTDSGRKNCKECRIPHVRDAGARLVAERYAQLAELAREAPSR